jgi:hypothetical protein
MIFRKFKNIAQSSERIFCIFSPENFSSKKGFSVEQDIFCRCAGICHHGQSFSPGGQDVSRK